jgi:hypothetical protein
MEGEAVYHVKYARPAAELLLEAHEVKEGRFRGGDFDRHAGTARRHDRRLPGTGLQSELDTLPADADRLAITLGHDLRHLDRLRRRAVQGRGGEQADTVGFGVGEEVVDPPFDRRGAVDAM